MEKAIDEAPTEAQGDPWFRTRSPEQAIHLCETAYYPHRLRLLGPSRSFGFTQRVTQVGPITMGDITYETDVALGFDQNRSSYQVLVPLTAAISARTPTIADSDPSASSTHSPESSSLARPSTINSCAVHAVHAVHAVT